MSYMKTKVIKTIAHMRQFRKGVQGSVGFIPTMGFLHAGHLSLVTKAQQENDVVIISIFVNPKQFGPKDDFQTYPRDTDRDLALLETTGKEVVVFLPTPEEMYPDGYETSVNVDDITTRLEGKVRPGHFQGVATVVTKLFNITQPTRAYFGQKDVQQVVVMKKMVEDLNMPLEIIVCNTVREADGLAMSSRNVFLDDVNRKQAVVLSKALRLALGLFDEGEYNAEKIKNAMKKLIHTSSGVIDYISIANPKTLHEVKTIEKKALVSLAVRFGKTRLIDNIILS